MSHVQLFDCLRIIIIHNIVKIYTKWKFKSLIIYPTSQLPDNLFLKHRERNLLGQESVRALDLTILKLFLWFYFSKRLSVATLFWNWKKILKKNYACSGYKCSLLQNCFSVLGWCVRLCECNIPKLDMSS